MIFKKIKGLIIFCLSIFLYLRYCIFTRSDLSTDNLQENKNTKGDFIKSSFEDYVSQEMCDTIEELRVELDVPSIQVSIVSKDHGEFNYISGYANIEKKKIATLNTVYYLGSLTKLYVQAVILKLVQDKKVSLDDLVIDYINIYPNDKSVTINHLLDHSSGLYDLLSSRRHLFKLYFLGKRHTTEDILRNVRENKPYFAPGEKRKYSNTGYILLGLIAEKVTNKSFSYLLNQFFLDNYKLTNTFYSSQDELPNSLATGYDLDMYRLDKVGLKANVEKYPFSLPTAGFTSGGIVSNASNVCNFLFNIFNTSVLDDKYIRKLRLFFIPKNKENIVLRTNIGHICGYYNFSGYSDSKKFSIVVLTNLSYASGGVYIPEKVADKIIETMVNNGIF
ncbi:serine hydrolase domain-containing protein [Psychrobacillus psychrotolerans]|uniref:serine hydrolase domain-containing protein n=1 Tax=Psychrobacillus psychrotolerans TaxID=126156 RepID=UPI0033146E09